MARSVRVRRRREQHPAGVLHPLAAVLALAQRRSGSGVVQRRREQRLAIAQRLLDPLPEALVAPAAVRERFWLALRWGGLGLILARLLRP